MIEERPQFLTGKYFIQGALIPAVQSPVTRGKILGAVGSQVMPIGYLCELYAFDNDQISLPTQVVLPLDVILSMGFYLYDDKAVWEVDSADVWARAQAIMRRVQQVVAMRGGGCQAEPELEPEPEMMQTQRPAPRRRRVTRPVSED